MTPRKEQSDEKKESILEEILRSVKSIGRNVEHILERFEEHAEDTNRGYDEWREEDLYRNNDY
jgi:hypothetical protein